MPFSNRINWLKEIDNIKELGLAGASVADVANHYGVSRQRIHQITAKFIPDWKEKYGWVVRRQEKQETYFKKWGNKVDSDLYKEQRSKYRTKKHNAKSRGILWQLDFGDVIWNTHCPVLGMELDYFSEGRQENSASFDKLDPGKGYVVGNVQIISWRANRIKNDGDAQEHRLIADYLDKLSSTNSCMST